MKELIAQLEEVERQKRELEASLAAAKEQGRAKIVEEIRGMVSASGFDLYEILDLISPAPQAKKRGNRGNGAYRGWVSNDDPALTYVRGRMPGWIMSKMTDLGMTPKSKEDRRRFLETHCSPRD